VHGLRGGPGSAHSRTPFIGAGTPYYAGPGGHLGAFMAWDASTGKKVWEDKEPYPNWSGALVTAGDVAFLRDARRWFKAVDAKTGKLLSKFKVGSVSSVTRSRYRGPDGRQYVAVYAGIGGDWFLLAGTSLRRSHGRAPPSDPYKDIGRHTSQGGIVWIFGSNGEEATMPTTRHVIRAVRGHGRCRGCLQSGGTGEAPDQRGRVPRRRPDPAAASPGRQRAQRSSPGQARPGRWCQPVQRDELRRLSRRRCRRMVGPAWSMARWRYGGADDEIFTSIFLRATEGMPAYGGVIGTDGVWMLVAYIKAQAVPTVVPTTHGYPAATPVPRRRRPPRLRPRRSAGRAATRGVGGAGPDAGEVRLHRVSCGRPQGCRPVLQTSPPSTRARMWRLRSSRR